MIRTDRRPRIALPVRPEDAPHRGNYFAAVEAADAELVPVWDDGSVDGFDGLLLPGGGDVDPSFFHQENRGSRKIDRELDERQFAALDAFVKAGRPALGICRGHQLINVYFGGTLIQDLPNAADHRGMDRKDGSHATHATPDSILSQMYGECFSVNTAHHQAVDRPGEGLVIVQRCDDGVVEALRHRSLPVYGVQWHPERMCLAHTRADTVNGLRLLMWFAALCTGRPDPLHTVDCICDDH